MILFLSAPVTKRLTAASHCIPQRTCTLLFCLIPSMAVAGKSNGPTNQATVALLIASTTSDAMNETKVRVAISLIYYKAVKPGLYIVDMSWEVWRRFLSANQRQRQEMIVPKVAPSVDGSVKELVWIPLNNQNKLQIIDENNVISI